jgi:hypothetical protein
VAIFILGPRFGRGAASLRLLEQGCIRAAECGEAITVDLAAEKIVMQKSANASSAAIRVTTLAIHHAQRIDGR